MSHVDRIAEILEDHGVHREHLARYIADAVHPRIDTVEQLDERQGQALREIRACIENYNYSGVARRIKQIMDEAGV